MKKNIIVSIPYIGCTSFLQCDSIDVELELGGRVNTLHRVYFISTYRMQHFATMDVSSCQYPTSGVLHFYRYCNKQHTNSICQCVNTLHRVYFISTEMNVFRRSKIFVSIPYIGCTSFLLEGRKEIHMKRIVSIPYIGCTSFLQWCYKRIAVNSIVSIPYIGCTSFLLYCPRPPINTGFLNLFLHVFVRIF